MLINTSVLNCEVKHVKQAVHGAVDMKTTLLFGRTRDFTGFGRKACFVVQTATDDYSVLR